MSDRKPSMRRGLAKTIAGLAIVAASVFGLWYGSTLTVEGVKEMRLAMAESQWVGEWTFTHRAADGTVLSRETLTNALVDAGEQDLLEVYFTAATAPTQFYLRLADSSSPCSIGETDNLTTMAGGEPSTNGYAAQLVERSGTGFPTSELDSGDWHVVSSTETFAASGGSWGPVHCALLATTSNNTGKGLAFVALSQARTLADGESLDVSVDIKLQ